MQNKTLTLSSSMKAVRSKEAVEQKFETSKSSVYKI